MMAAAVFGTTPNTQVILVEKDKEPQQESYLFGRSGTPQDRHIHALLGGGREAIEKYLPGFTDSLVKHGAVVCDRANDVSWYHFGGWKTRYVDGGKYYWVTRPVIDMAMRECLASIPSVQWKYESRAEALELSPSDGSVCGIRLFSGEVIKTSLVIDASGRLGCGQKLLDRAGITECPRETKLDVDVQYSTMLCELESWDSSANLILIHPTETTSAGLGMAKVSHMCVPQGGNPNKVYILCTMFSYGSSLTHNSEFDFFDDVLRIGGLSIAALMSNASPTHEKPYTYSYKSQRRLHWEEMDILPDGFLCVGDAVCSFDPVFGQGMTHAVLGISDLDGIKKSLIQGKKTVEARTIISKRGDIPFYLNTIEDFRYPSTRGTPPWGLKILQMAAKRMFMAQHTSEEVSKKLWRVAHMQEGVSSLLSPMFFLRVVWHGFGFGKYFNV